MNNTKTIAKKDKIQLDDIVNDFIGLNTKYQVVNGKEINRTYLDSCASTLMMKSAFQTSKIFLNHYSNTHSLMHNSAKIATKTYDWVHQKILKFVNANPKQYTCFFMGSGVTAGMNRIARTFKDIRPGKQIVLVSLMEHHSNDLPHRKHGGQVVHIPINVNNDQMGAVDLNVFEDYLKQNQNNVNYVAITGISNVTGIINPINDIAKLSHKYGAYIIVDAAQMAAHVPIDMSPNTDSDYDIDALLFSGHKTYAPGSPGVIIVKKNIMLASSPVDVGGGMVERVFPDRYIIKQNFPDREEPGTPNILGAITLGSAIEVLDQVGMNTIFKKDLKITNYALEKMKQINEILIYGDLNTNKSIRAGTIAFNILGLNHGIVAAILNDYFNIAVRNECFCAHPYVEKMLETSHKNSIKESKMKKNKKWKNEPWMGMVRISFGIYNNYDDINYFIESLKEIISNQNYYKPFYTIDQFGNYKHKEFLLSSKKYFHLSKIVKEQILNK